jgi:hypothetical protein
LTRFIRAIRTRRSNKLSHEASLVERIEKLAYGKLEEESHRRPAPAKRPKTLSS